MADGEQKASLAFSFQKKKIVQKVAVNLEENKNAGQLITGFDGAKAQVVGGEAEAKALVIPKLENTFKTGVGPKKFTPTFKPPSGEVVNVKDGEDRFVQAAESTVPVITEYGLQLRDVKPEERAAAAAAANGGKNMAAAAAEEKAYKESVEELPEVADLDAYEAMPIEEFGRAMLRGMGWEDGMGVGRNRKKVDAIEYVRRPERLGLGAQPVKVAEDKSKVVKMGDKPRKQDLVLAPDADGRQRNVRTLDEKLVARATVQPGPQPNKPMRIMGGPHSGLLCTALEALPKPEGRPERWRVRLTASNEDVEVLASELGERWQKDPAAAAAGGSGGAREERAGSAGPRRGREGEEVEGEEDEGGRAAPSGRERSRSADPDAGYRRGGSADDDRDRRRDKERDRDRERERERERDDDRGGGGSKRRHRDEEDDEDGGGGKHRSKHHKHEKREKHDKKDKKDKKHKREKESREHRHRDRGRSDSDEGDVSDGEGRPGSGPTWLFPHIQVRIVDKSVRGGKLYLKKGTVVDVHPGATADVAVGDTGDVLRLPQSSLETVVPKHDGAPVMVVGGTHRGQRGRLLQVNLNAGAAAVQLSADFSIVRLLLDDVAGYAGEMEEE
ncbi:hypothetical protein HYH02_013099 [Chlamydomonas schloesseri]|uniref:G-patch domain-containing protein n=1 Tax=Chlamydomonas schloesseri TaxID=2026947 RepID=A0A835W035_9CHLO|nr:hypothetical protein HYH02_013099 [Chlamydomonas schloesseri]|eukprot:KAG2432029.1 hypothetical protein HYH02_013099 [Chlamydomonas schloesseri]